MDRFSRRVALVVALGMVLVPALVPLATADHSYSHRYIVFGRLIDADGNPIVGATVDVGVDPTVNVEGLCGRQPDTGTDAWQETVTRRETNEYGEFIYCFHTHSISRGTRADVHVRYENVTVSEEIDPFYRRNFVVLQTEGSSGEENAQFAGTYLVSGRAWYDKPARVEQISVYGKTLDFANVTVTFTTASGEEITEEATTNGYGDFAVRVPVVDAAGGEVRVSVAGETVTADANPTVRATDFNIEVPDPENMLGTVLKVAGAIIIAGLVVGGGAFAWKKTSEKREIAQARAASTRKRAKR